MTQLPLIDVPAKLTERQERAYAILQDAGSEGVTALELGAALHGHDRCDWCKPSGDEVARALKRKGLAVERRKPHRRFVAVGAKARGDFGAVPY